MTFLRMKFATAVTLSATVLCLLASAASGGPRKPPKADSPDTRATLVRLQKESGLSLVTIDDDCLKYIDFRTSAAKVLVRLPKEVSRPAPQGSEFHYSIDLAHKQMVVSHDRADGVRIAFLVNLADGSVTELKGCFPLEVSLSTGGQSIAYVTKMTQDGKDYELWRYDLPSKKNELLSAHVWEDAAPQWSADDRYILYDYRDERMKYEDLAIAVYDTATNSERVLNRKALSPSWQLPGKQYLFWDDYDHFRIYRSHLDRDGVRERVAIKGPLPVLRDMPIRFSPSGSHMAYIRGSPWDVLNIKGFAWVDLMVKGDGKPVRVFGPYERNRKLTFFWAEVPEAMKSP